MSILFSIHILSCSFITDNTYYSLSISVSPLIFSLSQTLCKQTHTTAKLPRHKSPAHTHSFSDTCLPDSKISHQTNFPSLQKVPGAKMPFSVKLSSRMESFLLPQIIDLTRLQPGQVQRHCSFWQNKTSPQPPEQAGTFSLQRRIPVKKSQKSFLCQIFCQFFSACMKIAIPVNPVIQFFQFHTFSLLL